MKFKEELLKLIEELEKFNLDRRSIEMELGFSEKYLDQQLSTGGNIKLVKSLKMLLRVKTLEKTIEEQKNSPALLNQANEDVNTILHRIYKTVNDVAIVATDAREHTLLTESLSRTLLSHSAHMEQRQFGGDYDKISDALHQVTATAYKQLRQINSEGRPTEKVA